MLIVAVVMSDRWAQTRCNDATLAAQPHSASCVAVASVAFKIGAALCLDHIFATFIFSSASGSGVNHGKSDYGDGELHILF